jgi:alpha-L-fucosidase
VAQWLRRQMDLVEKYRPDLVYLDDYGIPFGRTGLEAVAHYYGKSLEWHGAIEGVLTAKRLSDFQRYAIVEDVERGFSAGTRPLPWQTDTCIGNWHYDRALYERHGYKTAKAVVQRLCDVVAKNGNLLLSIPVRGDGSIDEDEERILGDLADWFAAHGEAIYGTRPWRRFGEGPTQPPLGMMAEAELKPFTSKDVRFTVGKGALNAFFLEWPEGEGRIASLSETDLPSVSIERIETIAGRPLRFRRDSDSLRISLPRPKRGEFVPAIRILGRGLA